MYKCHTNMELLPLAQIKIIILHQFSSQFLTPSFTKKYTHIPSHNRQPNSFRNTNTQVHSLTLVNILYKR